MIRTASIRDLQPFEATELVQIAKHAHVVDSHSIGWLPNAVYDRYAAQGTLIACHNNDDLVGYICHNESPIECRIYVTWVRNDARLIMHGRALVAHLQAICRTRGIPTIGLWCAEDLAANTFWDAIGFRRTSWRWGRSKKGRRHNQWHLPTAAQLVTA